MAKVKEDFYKAVDKTESPAFPKYDFFLAVKNPFLDYPKGTTFTTDEEIQFVIDNGYLSNCVKYKPSRS